MTPAFLAGEGIAVTLITHTFLLNGVSFLTVLAELCYFSVDLFICMGVVCVL
jgi:hypothetical protein